MKRNLLISILQTFLLCYVIGVVFVALYVYTIIGFSALSYKNTTINTTNTDAIRISYGYRVAVEDFNINQYESLTINKDRNSNLFIEKLR